MRYLTIVLFILLSVALHGQSYKPYYGRHNFVDQLKITGSFHVDDTAIYISRGADSAWISVRGSDLHISGDVAGGLDSIIFDLPTNIDEGSGGTVTSFSAGDLSPIFTTNETNPSTTPALTFTLSNAAAYRVLWNNTGSSASPAFNYLDTTAFNNLWFSLVRSQVSANTPVTFSAITGKISIDTTRANGYVTSKYYVDSLLSTLTPNATHTGEVTGATTLTVDKTAITNKSNVTAASGDKILIADASDSENLKYVTAGSIASLAAAGVTDVTASSPISSSGGATPNITADTTDAPGALTTNDQLRNTDSVGTITRGTWQGTSIDTTYTNAVSDVAAGTGVSVTTAGKRKIVSATNTGTVTSIATTSPITGGPITTTGTIEINNAAADGSTKGAASFAAADFDASSGNISLDYTNGQASSGSTKGFLSSTDWTTFNNKVSTTRSISTNAPLTGGGDLSANRTLSLDTGAAGRLKPNAATIYYVDSVAGTITPFTVEAAQDAVGAMVDGTIIYTDGTPLLSRAGLTGAITASAGSNTTALGSFTKSELSTAVSDGDVLFVGDVTTNATHTGEVTGATALTVDKTAITNKTNVTAATGDKVLIADASDSDNLKYVTAQSIANLATGTVTNTGGSLTSNSVVLGAGSSDIKVLDGFTTDGAGQLTLGKLNTTKGSLRMYGNTSGNVTINPPAVAGNNIVLTTPVTTGTIAINAVNNNFTAPQSISTAGGSGQGFKHTATASNQYATSDWFNSSGDQMQLLVTGVDFSNAIFTARTASIAYYGSGGMNIVQGNASGDLNLATGGYATSNKRITIKPGGAVGIGTTTPASTVDIEGSLTVGAAYSGTTAAPANGILVEGQIGIAVPSPTAWLHIAASVSGYANIRFVDGVSPTKASGNLFFDNDNLYLQDATYDYTIVKILKVSETLDFPSTDANQTSELTVTLTGAAENDQILLGVGKNAMPTHGTYFAYVSGANTVTVRFSNNSLSAQNPTSATFNISVVK